MCGLQIQAEIEATTKRRSEAYGNRPIFTPMPEAKKTEKVMPEAKKTGTALPVAKKAEKPKVEAKKTEEPQSAEKAPRVSPEAPNCSADDVTPVAVRQRSGECHALHHKHGSLHGGLTNRAASCSMLNSLC